MRLEDRIRNELHDTAERLALDPGEYRRAIEVAQRRRQRRIIGALSGMVVVAGLVVISLALRPGDEVVVFLQGQPPAIPALFGLSQGVYRVRRDSAARAVVVPAPVAARGAGAERVVRGDPVRRPMPVEAFAREVRAILEVRR